MNLQQERGPHKVVEREAVVREGMLAALYREATHPNRIGGCIQR